MMSQLTQKGRSSLAEFNKKRNENSYLPIIHKFNKRKQWKLQKTFFNDKRKLSTNKQEKDLRKSTSSFYWENSFWNEPWVEGAKTSMKKRTGILSLYFNATNSAWCWTWLPLHKKIKLSIKDFFSKCDQIRRKLRIWSHLLKKFLMENFVFYAVCQFRVYKWFTSAKKSSWLQWLDFYRMTTHILDKNKDIEENGGGAYPFF